MTSDYGEKPILGGEASLKIGAVECMFGEATISIDRAAVAASRSGKWSDYKRAGKVDITGTIRRLLVDGEQFSKLLGGNTIGAGVEFNMVVSGSHTDNSFVATLNNCFFTSGEIICGASDTFIEEPHNYEMRDADAGFNLVWL